MCQQKAKWIVAHHMVDNTGAEPLRVCDHCLPGIITKQGVYVFSVYSETGARLKARVGKMRKTPTKTEHLVVKKLTNKKARSEVDTSKV